MDKARIRVDFNELIEPDLVLLSKTDIVEDSDGNSIELTTGKIISIYEFNEYAGGEKEYLLAEGIAELNNPANNGEWTRIVKWCWRINHKGISVE